MKYQGYIIGKELAPNNYDLRQFSVPVHQVDGAWFPAGKPHEETSITHRLDMVMSVHEFQVHTDNTCGPLDDLPCDDGWKVMARYWLPDDYVPPTPDDVERGRQEAIDHLKKMGVWKDKE